MLLRQSKVADTAGCKSWSHFLLLSKVIRSPELNNFRAELSDLELGGVLRTYKSALNHTGGRKRLASNHWDKLIVETPKSSSARILLPSSRCRTQMRGMIGNDPAVIRSTWITDRGLSIRYTDTEATMRLDSQDLYLSIQKIEQLEG